MQSNVGVVILAAGHGTRMKSSTPKVMHFLHGKPLVAHVVEKVEQSGICEKPVIVVSGDHSLVQDFLGDRALYAIQAKQLGTGHATACAEEVLGTTFQHVIVLYGDMPFISPASIRRLAERHLERDNTVTLMTITVPNFEGEYSPFYTFGRIIRSTEDGHITKIVEKKDCAKEELQIRELNASYFCFKASWLWDTLKKLDNNNAQKEFYLTDLIKIAIEDGEKISSIDIEPKETLGVNSPEDLVVAHDVVSVNRHNQ